MFGDELMGEMTPLLKLILFVQYTYTHTLGVKMSKLERVTNLIFIIFPSGNGICYLGQRPSAGFFHQKPAKKG